MAKQPRRSTSLGDDAMAKPEAMSIVPVEHVQSKILLIRCRKVILDADLAGLYGVQTRVLVQAVKRNIGRFPPDFMFQLDQEEFNRLKSQTVISNGILRRGGRRYHPYAFTEHGAIMAAGVLNSERAVQASIFVVRAFVRQARPPGTEGAGPRQRHRRDRRRHPSAHAPAGGTPARALRLPPSQKALTPMRRRSPSRQAPRNDYTVPRIRRRSIVWKTANGRSSIPETSACHALGCRRSDTRTWSSSEMKEYRRCESVCGG